MAIIGYIRVSSKDQNTDRQRQKLLAIGVEERLIFEDKASGKDFNREQYQFMRNQVLRAGDVLYIDSLDRLGRDYDSIISEWKHITRNIMADIIVLDQESLFDSRKFKQQGDIGKLLEDNMLALLSYIADSERKKIRQRQKEGIAVAQSKGVALGRKAITLTSEQKSIFVAWSSGNLKTTEAIKKTGFSKSTFYYFSKKHNYNKKSL